MQWDLQAQLTESTDGDDVPFGSVGIGNIDCTIPVGGILDHGLLGFGIDPRTRSENRRTRQRVTPRGQVIPPSVKIVTFRDQRMEVTNTTAEWNDQMEVNYLANLYWQAQEIELVMATQ